MLTTTHLLDYPFPNSFIHHSHLGAEPIPAAARLFAASTAAAAPFFWGEPAEDR